MGSDDVYISPRYQDLEYQQTHSSLFASALLRPLEDVLPPGVNQEEFDRATVEFREVVGSDNVVLGKGLREYVDPYELNEHEGRRNAPSCAIWYWMNHSSSISDGLIGDLVLHPLKSFEKSSRSRTASASLCGPFLAGKILDVRKSSSIL